MIHGSNRASGFALTGDGKTVLYEMRQCVHCEYMWEYKPGSGITRGFCMSCHGLLCMRAECIAEQRQHLAWAQENGWVMTRSCLPIEEWCMRLMDAKVKHEADGRKQGTDFELSQSGLYLPIT